MQDKTNAIQIFDNEEFGAIRTVEIEEQPWLVAKDVALALGYKNPQEAIRNHVDAEDKGVSEILTPGGMQKIQIINESGLYALVLSSKLPNAKQFRRWVTNEVLPTIRKTGSYAVPQSTQPPKLTADFLRQIAHKMEQDEKTIRRLNNQTDCLLQQNAGLSRQNARMQPKARYYDRLVDTEGYTNFRVTAKEIGVSERRLIAALLDKHILFRAKNGALLPFSRVLQADMFVVREFYVNGLACTQTLLTPKGRCYVLHFCLKNGLLKGEDAC